MGVEDTGEGEGCGGADSDEAETTIGAGTAEKAAIAAAGTSAGADGKWSAGGVIGAMGLVLHSYIHPKAHE